MPEPELDKPTPNIALGLSITADAEVIKADGEPGEKEKE